ncbi:hypothetical protein J5U23_01827 [Saccharolobus shibatae B12]|uniref:Uncharacterized protein n=1 Tax=Saccharolobus shibatae (strain ATCC 51178 / DSM 5389 / JCM 8931 / NBRC 15437 / B12) TaxID=523848 RepID=A0A8F5BPL3_SACSH|nr:hypothetical protein J5U23_01827 [Saccharolobus shibatae B12]
MLKMSELNVSNEIYFVFINAHIPFTLAKKKTINGVSCELSFLFLYKYNKI